MTQRGTVDGRMLLREGVRFTLGGENVRLLMINRSIRKDSVKFGGNAFAYLFLNSVRVGKLFERN